MNRNRLIAMAALAGMMACAGVATGQKAEQPRQANSGTAFTGLDSPERQAWLATTISLDFPGGKLSEYVAAIRKAAGSTAVNVSCAAAAENLEMPAVSFREVQIETAIRAIDRLQPVKANERLYVSEVVPEQRAGLMAVRAGAPVFVVMHETSRSRVASESKDRVISLNRLIGGKEPIAAEVVLSAVETALGNKADDRTGPELKFHRDSGLLFVSGTAEQCGLAAEVVDTLLADADRRNAGAAKVTTEQIPLAHVDAATVVDAIRLAFPSRPDEPEPLKIVANDSTNSVVLSGTPMMIAAGRALTRYVDSKPEMNPLMMQARIAETEARQRMAEAAKEAAAARDQLAKNLDDATQAKVQAEVERARAEAVAAELATTRKRFEDVRAEQLKLMTDAESRLRAGQDEMLAAKMELERLRMRLEACEKERAAKAQEKPR